MKKNSFKVVKICPSRPVVLITGAGSPGVVGIIQRLRTWFYVISVDCDPEAVGFKFSDGFYTVPPASSDDFIPELLRICRENCVKVVFPKVTAELSKLSEAREFFKEEGIEILISSKDSIDNANNKGKFLGKCMEGLIPTPLFFTANKFCSKPLEGSGGDGFKVYEEGGVVMEYLPGDEFSVDALCNNGKAITIVVRTREKVRAGVTMVGTVVQDPEIIETSKKIIKELKLHGLIGLQFKRGEDGVAYPIECNPRLQGSIMLSEMACGNLFENAYNLAVGNELEDTDVKYITMRRYLKEFYE